MSFDFEAMADTALLRYGHDKPEVIAFDTETSGVDWHDEAFCVTVAWKGHDGIETHYIELGEGRDEMVSEMLDLAPTWVGHNIKFDLQKVLMAGIVPRKSIYSGRIHDTQLIAHLLDEHRQKDLKGLTRLLFGEETDEDTAVKEAKKVLKKEQGFRSESDIGYHLLPREVVVPYAIKDAEFTLRIFDRLYPQLLRYEDMLGLYDQERDLLLTLLDMEARGFAVDVPYVKKAMQEYGAHQLGIEAEIAEIAGRPVGKKKDEFNPNSPKQIMELLGITCTDREALKKVDHPLAATILELRGVTKMHGTYLVPILREVRDGIIHPNFRQNVRTGRMASGGAEA